MTIKVFFGVNITLYEFVNSWRCELGHKFVFLRHNHEILFYASPWSKLCGYISTTIIATHIWLQILIVSTVLTCVKQNDILFLKYRQYIGDHIKCISDGAIPAHVINSFCFFTPTFTVVSIHLFVTFDRYINNILKILIGNMLCIGASLQSNIVRCWFATSSRHR